MTEKCWLYDNCNHRDCDKDFCLRKHKLDFLYGAALLTDTQKKPIVLFVDKDQTDLEAFKQLKGIQTGIIDFVNNGRNLYLHSHNCGNGKTSWSLKLLQAYMNKIWPGSDMICRALFISVPRFLLALKANISQKNDYVEQVMTGLETADLVVWDDIAAKTGTDFELNHLLSLIDTRIAMGKSNIYTSNLGRNEMYSALGDRLGSRICQYSLDIELKGADKRQLAVKGDFK